MNNKKIFIFLYIFLLILLILFSFFYKNNINKGKVIGKNGIEFKYNTLQNIINKCKFFEGKANYYTEEDKNGKLFKIYHEKFNFKAFTYEAIENNWCPGPGTKVEKRHRIDSIVIGKVPFELEVFSSINSVDDLYKLKYNNATISTFLALYMITLKNDDKKFKKYLSIYNSFIKKSSSLGNKINEEYYFPLFFALISKNNDCETYIEKNLIDLK